MRPGTVLGQPVGPETETGGERFAAAAERERGQNDFGQEHVVLHRSAARTAAATARGRRRPQRDDDDNGSDDDDGGGRGDDGQFGVRVVRLFVDAVLESERIRVARPGDAPSAVPVRRRRREIATAAPRRWRRRRDGRHAFVAPRVPSQQQFVRLFENVTRLRVGRLHVVVVRRRCLRNPQTQRWQRRRRRFRFRPRVVGVPAAPAGRRRLRGPDEPGTRLGIERASRRQPGVRRPTATDATGMVRPGGNVLRRAQTARINRYDRRMRFSRIIILLS